MDGTSAMANADTRTPDVTCSAISPSLFPVGARLKPGVQKMRRLVMRRRQAQEVRRLMIRRSKVQQADCRRNVDCSVVPAAASCHALGETKGQSASEDSRVRKSLQVRKGRRG